MLHAVVMAGGSGTRFWPMSRRCRPKHLLSLVGTASLLQQTVERVTPWVPLDRVLIITGSDHVGDVRHQLQELPADAIIAEPLRRDTAPCIGLAAEILLKLDPDATMLVLPADHAIDPASEFQSAIEHACRLVAEDRRRLVTLGIKPNRPATGYGYIERGPDLAGAGVAFEVKRFREKPDYELAQQYVRSGNYYWNSGVFLWAARTILNEIQTNRPELAESLRRIGRAWKTPDFEATLEHEYHRIAGISIDYAVLEQAKHVVVVEARFHWDDVGSWGSVERLLDRADDTNTVRGLHCGIDTESSIVITDSDHLVGTIGVRDLIIVQCGKATLVADKRREESVKQLVEEIRRRGLEAYL